jgi:hypothetical protein
MKVTMCSGVKGSFALAALPCVSRIPLTSLPNLGKSQGDPNPCNAQKCATAAAAVNATPDEPENSAESTININPADILSPIDCAVDDKILNLVEGFDGRRLNLPGQLDRWEEVTPRSTKNVPGEFICLQRSLLLGYGRRPASMASFCA